VKSINLSDFDFSVPAELIAKYPLKNRDGCRLLVVRRTTEATCGEPFDFAQGKLRRATDGHGEPVFEHRQFLDILEYLQPGDVLVLNDAKVNKSRFFATRSNGGKVEVLLTRSINDTVGANLQVRPGESKDSPLPKNDLSWEGQPQGVAPTKRKQGDGGQVLEAILSHSARIKEGEFLTLISPLNGNVGARRALPSGAVLEPPLQQNGDGFSSLFLRRRGTEGEVSFPPPRVGEGLPEPSSVLGQGSGERSGFRILSKQNNRACVQIESETDIFEKYGTIPIPPYLERPAEKEDDEDYQTVFAKTPGATAAPTAGLHFTPELLDRIKSKGVEIGYLSLMVGPGTFEPIRTDDITRHKMQKEYFEIGEETCAKINTAKRAGKKIWAVGTTVVKALETAARVVGAGPRACPGVEGRPRGVAPTNTNELQPLSGDSDLFIHPPFDFKIVDGLITNFHWPRSTLILLVAAFAGKDQILSAYHQAIAQRYRFFSYGDAMLIY